MSLTVRVHSTVAEIGREAWDALAAPTGDPFLGFDFLDACEASGSAVPTQGWAGRHLTLEDDGRLIGAMPLWLSPVQVMVMNISAAQAAYAAEVASALGEELRLVEAV